MSGTRFLKSSELLSLVWPGACGTPSQAAGWLIQCKSCACRSRSLGGQASALPGHLIGALAIWTAWTKRKYLALGPWTATFPQNVPKISHNRVLSCLSSHLLRHYSTVFTSHCSQCPGAFRASKPVQIDLKKKKGGECISQSLTVAFQENVMFLQA